MASRSTRIGVVGMGYVGLPLALTFCERGFHTTGFDIDDKKVEILNGGGSYIEHLGRQRVPHALAAGLLDATTDFDRLAEMDAILIAVPTPLTRQREPDMRYVVSTTQQIRETLREGQLIVLESTTYPGTTDGVVREILESSGRRCGLDFFLAFSPEREDPGNEQYDTYSIPKLVGGVDQASTELAAMLYGAAFREVVTVASARAAEATKLTENIFRAVNIALVNELKIVYARMGIDIWDVLDAASTKPFGFMRFDPGPGLGGHCIPIDPFYLTWKAREYGVATRFIELAGEVNLSMPRYVIHRLQDALNDRGIPLRGSRVLMVGLAYKRDIDDPRESPSFELMALLLQHRAIVEYHDPYIPRMPSMRSWPHLEAKRSLALDAAAVESFDCVLIATDHSEVDYEMLLSHAKLIVDTRGVYRRAHPNVVKA